MDRRTAIAAMIAGIAVPTRAKLAPAGPSIKARPIRWPSGDGGTLHGFMAIPAKAKGKQPAVLVLAPPTGQADTSRDIVAAVAQAGLIGCAPDPAMITAAASGTARALADLEATIRWLGSNAYATGAVGLLGTAGTESLFMRLAATPAVAGAALLAPAAALTTIHPRGTILTVPVATPTEWTAAWPRAMAFLREHLQ